MTTHGQYPLVDHDGFVAGGLYAVGDFDTSSDLAPASGSYTYNEYAPVRITEQGENYGNGNWIEASANTYGFSASPSVIWDEGCRYCNCKFRRCVYGF